MKRLILVRHAKTEVIRYDISDYQRSLVNRGINDSKLIANKLFLKNIIPDLMISSPANRAIETTLLFADVLQYPIDKIEQNDDLYDGFTTHEFLGLLDKLGKENETVMVVGHNPSIEYLAFNLTEEFYKAVPTCTVIGIDFQVDEWADIEVRTGKLAFYEYPKKYKEVK
ncbi:phosphoglycerate mutase [Labilibaculum sp. A4]|uniref:SixA phosphatase family protein n=1 Tax=Labilibaculum euxinus TaxID=2686357 RepID=UPI000F62598B|nr:histidine phosphatase family protein [Labilibaculum euxinus]MDQ1771572.1 histidine phosphatase family protein [Labilibaculum euxinus]MWN76539.1 phosphoglycerate mutase [Labilibaculum euxinus]